MCRDENLDDVHLIKNGRFYEWYEDYKMFDWVEVGPVEAFIKVRILGASNGLDLLTSRAFEREARSYERRVLPRVVRAGSYHIRPENQANDFEKVY